MSLTLLGDLLPYDLYFRAGYVEGSDYFMEIFNGGSNGTIRLESENSTGTLKHIAHTKDFGVISDRDITSDSAQSVHKIEKAEHTAFKTFWKFEPVEFQWTAFKTSDNMTKEEVMFLIGRKFAERKLAHNVAKALAIAAAAIGSSASLTIDKATVPANFVSSDILAGQSKFGDASSRLRCLIMHSGVYFPLVKDQALNYKYNDLGLIVNGGTPATYNLPVVVTDSPQLTYTEEGTTLYKTLLLADGAVTIKDNGNTQALADDIAGHENIKTIFQAEGDQWNYVLGYQLKAAAGPGANPSSATLANSANWERWVNSDKLTAGVLIKSAGSLDDVTQITNVKIVS